ncbi:hypothetical protein R3P38DRAFT_2804240 [Favolaschia claudopus]|uniref:Ubiquitin-like protease family profile domain-containing protein n=1 Tax=Favolaschia claudopus TaxID=2862362 RepID=A0AAV9ZRJ3_9AGAR
MLHAKQAVHLRCEEGRKAQHVRDVTCAFIDPIRGQPISGDSNYCTLSTLRGKDYCTLSILPTQVFPLFGKHPAHWVLGLIEPGPRLYHLFDSLPELNNVSWAEPALLELGDTVYATLGHMKIDWSLWKMVLHSPPELERQMNDWACGFFVIHAMKCLADGTEIEKVTNKETENVRDNTLALVTKNPGGQ